MITPLWLLTACQSFGPTTYIDELRIMAVQTVPAEISPSDDTIEINILIADPLDNGADVLIWTCTNLGEGCLEEQFYPDMSEGWVHSFSYEEPVSNISFPLNPGLEVLVQELPEDLIPFEGTTLWALACQPMQCPAISDFKAGTLDSKFLSNPSTMIADLGFGVASLAKRRLRISNRPLEERIQNPILAPAFEDNPSIKINESNGLTFDYVLNSEKQTGASLSGYSSAGSIRLERGANSQSEKIDLEGEWSLTWEGGEIPETGAFYMVLENGDGGVDFWTGLASVKE